MPGYRKPPAPRTRSEPRKERYAGKPSESDKTGVFIGQETDEETGESWILYHGGDKWRPSWTY